MEKKDTTLADSDARLNAARDIHNSYIIEAGAGTGKTTILLERVENILLQEETHLSEIVIITFTEKAAAELKMKLRNKLEELYKQPEHSAKIARALEEYEKSTVSTIHSFTASMLRERPVEARIDPGFEVSDDLTSSLLFDEIWQEWLEREMERSPEGLRRALSFDIRIAPIKDIAARIVINRDIRKGRPQKAHVSASDFIRTFEEHLEELKDIAAKYCQNSEDKGYEQIIDLVRVHERLQKLDEENAEREICGIKVNLKSGAKSNWSEAAHMGRVKEIFGELSAKVDDFRQRVAQNICAEVAEWLDGFVDFFESEKKKQGYLDFEDLLIYARDMLKENLEVRRYFQEKFRYILVDEFQDTDPLQAEIVFFLSEEKPEAKSWRDVMVKKGKLFIVGDPKQSIYRFRRADIEIYAQAKELLMKNGREENIVVNFRTVPSIINWVNTTFESLMKREEGNDFQVDYIPIKPDRKQEEKMSQVILLYPSQEEEICKKEKATLQEIREVESRYVASLIQYAVREGNWRMLDKRTRAFRKAQFSDFAILFRTTTGMNMYEESLRAFNVPYRIVGGKHFFMKQEVMSLLAVMMAIDNPLDETSIAAALRSEFFGHSDEEIFIFKESEGNFKYVRGRRTDSPVEASLRILHEIHDLRNRREIPLSLMELFSRTKALELFYLKPQGEQRVANLLKIVNIARLHENVSLSSFKSFALWLEEMLIEEREGEESQIAEEDDDAVRMMTIHKAKGLEFPFVIIAALESGIRKEEKFIVDRKAGKFEFAFSELKPERFVRLSEAEEMRGEAEEQRIFYVAATRARDKLILPIFPKTGKAGLGKYLAGKIPENKSELRGREIEDAKAFFFDDNLLNKKMEELKPFKITFDEKSLEEDLSGIIEKRKALLNRISESKNNARKGVRFVSATSVKEELMHERETGTIHRRSQGAEIGKVVHELLSRMDLTEQRAMKMESMRGWMEAEYPGISGEICSLVNKALSSSTVRDAITSRRYIREVPFSITINGTILEGSIDMLFEQNERFIAVDYKTDTVKDDAEIEERMKVYETQASIYSFALSHIHGIKIKEIRFLFLNAQKEKVIKIDAAIIEKGKSFVMDDTMHIDLET